METLEIQTPAKFEETHKEAYQFIDKGIVLVTEGKDEEAVKLFQNGLLLIDKALSTKIEKFDIGANQVQLYAEMQIKMRSTRKEILIHYSNNLQHSGASHGLVPVSQPNDAPPSYEEYLCSLDSVVDQSNTSGAEVTGYPSLDLVAKTTADLKIPDLSPQSGELVLKIEDGVQIFFIYAGGRVTSPSSPSFLAIYMLPSAVCSNKATGSPGACGFLQVGEWSYPLVPGQSPVLHAFYGAYIFPDVTNTEPGTSVGILIPDTCAKGTQELFEQILNQMTSYQTQEIPSDVDVKQQTERVNKSASLRIAEGAETVSKGAIWGAEKLSVWITYGSEKLKSSIPASTEPQKVDPKWHKTAQTARSVSGQAVKVSGYLVNQVGKATMALGRKVAPTIQKKGTKAFSHFSGQTDKDASSQVNSAMEVASGAVHGVSTIYLGLEHAAFTLAQSLTDNTVKVVSHTYGPDVGRLTDNTLYAVGQTASAGYNVSSLGAKGIAKRAVKNAGKALIEDQGNRNQPMPKIEQTKDSVEITNNKKSGA